MVQQNFCADLVLAVGVRQPGSTVPEASIRNCHLNDDATELEETYRSSAIVENCLVIMYKHHTTFRARFDLRWFPFEALTCR